MNAPKTATELLDALISELQIAVANNGGGQAVGLPPPAAQQSNKASKAAKATPAAAPAPAAPAALTLNSLDLRVGRIVSVEKHATADKLYCEMIDIGEAEPRAIASGLVPHYTLEQMQGRRLIVVANLKPRSLVGFKSFGMVLCGAKEKEGGGETVEFVDPPPGAAIGDRVVIGAAGEVAPALSPSQVEKQKAWEGVGADLRLDAEGCAVWRGQRLYAVGQGEGEPCRAPTLRDCVVR